ncbi:hypothetical protein B296_00023397 [Ensete ventricosum]|uniref:Uncharacterized protein n=1 Tax=Ensete ventricosum TaxID=4639 RepID=A0A426ZVH9_ENSVE|nr:hypothetical protein B296_00023397 [Ensete ventricosum]
MLSASTRSTLSTSSLLAPYCFAFVLMLMQLSFGNYISIDAEVVVTMMSAAKMVVTSPLTYWSYPNLNQKLGSPELLSLLSGIREGEGEGEGVGRGVLTYDGVGEGFGDSGVLLREEWYDGGVGGWGETTGIYVDVHIVFG